LGACPWPDPGDPVDGDVGDVTGLDRAGRWELDIRPKVDVSKLLEKCGSTSFRDASSAVDDQVLNEPALIMGVCLERQDNPRVLSDVAHFSAFGEVPSYDLVTIQADPDDRHLRTAIGFQSYEVGEG